MIFSCWESLLLEIKADENFVINFQKRIVIINLHDLYSNLTYERLVFLPSNIFYQSWGSLSSGQETLNTPHLHQFLLLQKVTQKDFFKMEGILALNTTDHMLPSTMLAYLILRESRIFSSLHSC